MVVKVVLDLDRYGKNIRRSEKQGNEEKCDVELGTGLRELWV